MKKLAKILALVAMSLVLCLGVVAFSACGENVDKEVTYFGQYHYTSHGNEYGIAVNVTVKGDTITKVEKVASSYVECSAENPDYGWTADKIANWNNGLSGLLAKYNGKKVDDVKALTGSISGVDEAEKNELSDSNLVITGATQGCVRVLKAVQNALDTKAAAAKTVVGEYHYTSHGNEYGIKVSVTVVDGKIFNLAKVDSSYVECSAENPDYGWTADKIANWNNGLPGLLAKYNGKKVDDVKALTGSISGVDEAEKNELSDSNLVITGATQGCVRVLKAVQNALGNL